jgi:hypothetical protein
MRGILKLNPIRQEVWQYFDASSHAFTTQLGQQLGVSNLQVGQVLFTEDKECEVLKPYKGWQKGKIRIKLTIEFCPDEPEPIEENGHQDPNNSTESPWDEIRQQLTN